MFACSWWWNQLIGTLTLLVQRVGKSHMTNPWRLTIQRAEPLTEKLQGYGTRRPLRTS